MRDEEPLLRINNLLVGFNGTHAGMPVVRGIDLKVGAGEILGLVGESGCGKSVTCYSIVRLLGDEGWTEGEVLYGGKNLLEISEREIVSVRGREIAMIFQDAQSSLNPVKTIGFQLTESVAASEEMEGRSEEDVKLGAMRLLREVGISDSERVMGEYPHQLSGGINQRIMIAIMIAANPRLLIADEPTTALDVTIQAQILGLLKSIRDTRNMSIILVTHDLAVVAETCDQVAVMYGGLIVEYGPVAEVLSDPRHPYTFGLLRCKPRIDRKVEKLLSIEGVVPNPEEFTHGCPFYERCRRSEIRCRDDRLAPTFENGRRFHCYNPVRGEAVWQ
jgi:peptide/nickel transport system ATP-binding protein